MKFKMLLSLLMILGVLFMNSCGGKEEKLPELEKVDSVEDLIQDTALNTSDTEINVPDTIKAVKPSDDIANGEVVANEPVSIVQGGDYSKKALQGAVVSFNNIVSGGNGIISKAQALDLVSKGNPVVFKALDGSIYFVYNEDGSFAGKRLAGFANNQKVGILGKTKFIDGVNIFIMTMIEAL